MISKEMQPKSLSELAGEIHKDALEVENFLKEKGMPLPTFSKDAPPFMGIPPHMGPISEAYERLIMSTKELQTLAMGPMLQLKNMIPEDALSWNVISRFNVCEHVPIDGKISYADLAKACKAPELELRQAIRFAMTNFIFCEPEKGYVAHTATTRVVKEKPMIQMLLGTVMEEMFSAMASVADSMQKYPNSQEPASSGWGLANNARLPMFEELGKNQPARAARFANAMGAMATMGEQHASMFDYPWESLGEVKVVDVGGGKGPVSISLARKYPQLKFVVQDLPDTVAAGEKECPEDVKDRIEFQAVDFFADQQVKDADIFYLRLILHDWPDKYCVKILKSLVPAMKKGAKVLIQDRHVPEPLTMTPYLERDRRSFILKMQTLFNSRDREEGEWEALFKAADERFVYKGVTLPPNTAISRTPCLAFAVAEWSE